MPNLAGNPKLKAIENRMWEAESLLASATDLLNSWAREFSVKEAHNESEIKQVINRLWEASAHRRYSLDAPPFDSPEVAG